MCCQFRLDAFNDVHGYTSVSSAGKASLTAPLSGKFANHPLLLGPQTRPAGNLIQITPATRTDSLRIKYTDLDAG
jgi:hypothetical protein